MSERKPPGYWTLERCMEDAKQYSTRSEWSKGSRGAVKAAKRNGWQDACCEFMDHIDFSDRPQVPKGYWTLDRCLKDALRFSDAKSYYAESRSWHAAQRNGWLDLCTKHMTREFKATANDVVYIWRDAGTDLHKVGVTSDRIGERRIGICGKHNGMDPRIVFMLKVDDARAVESKLLELGTDPELDSSIDGYTEFRRLTDAQLGQAVSIAYEAALAA